MLLATPVLHHEAEPVGVEEKALGVTGSCRPQVDQEHDRELEPFGGMNREQRDGVRGGRLLAGLADRQLGVDDLVEVAHKISNACQRELAFEARRKLEDLAQVEQRAGAAVSLRTKLRPPQVARFLEQAVEDVRHGEGIPEST